MGIVRTHSIHSARVPGTVLGMHPFSGEWGMAWKTNMQGFPDGPVVKVPAASAGDTGSIPGLGRFQMPQSN